MAAGLVPLQEIGEDEEQVDAVGIPACLRGRGPHALQSFREAVRAAAMAGGPNGADAAAALAAIGEAIAAA